MSPRTRWCRTFTAAAMAVGLTTGTLFIFSPPSVAVAEDAAATKPIEKGLRVYSAGHSFHVFVPGQMAQMAQAAGIKDHFQIGLSSIGASRVIQHWNVLDDKFKSKEVLKSGRADVLTLAPIHLPDEGIEKFVTLGLEGNPNIRVTIEEFWLPYDIYDTSFTKHPKTVDHNAPTADDLRKLHAPYFKSMDEHVQELNKRFGKQVLLVVPAGQAVVALREKIIAGQVPGLKQQEDLFIDPLGHATAPLQVLVSYCHFAVIYQRSPVGLPMPQAMAAFKKPEWDDKLNLLLQELAWEVVTQHPLSGVKVAAAK